MLHENVESCGPATQVAGKTAMPLQDRQHDIAQRSDIASLCMQAHMTMLDKCCRVKTWSKNGLYWVNIWSKFSYVCHVLFSNIFFFLQEE